MTGFFHILQIAGMIAEVLEYPFDLAKVHLQAQLLVPSSSTTMRFEGPMHCLTQTWKELQRTIQTEFASSTLLCIAHRLNTIGTGRTAGTYLVISAPPP
ncbi:hypothetical protein BYT27DRAFT_7198693 [Phlegmacium glaucopus]|nr:hypothetical protein BYT27DRAFT_7198693 [Phlegmacium glaucopus]